MKPSGIIYKVGFPAFGVIHIRVPLRVRLLYQGVRGVSAGLIAYAILVALFTYGPLVKQEVSYRWGGGSSYSPDLADLVKAESTVETQVEAAKLGVNSYYSIVIPKIKASENIIANVDPANEKEYQDALSSGVAHAKGTFFPGQGKRVYLFSHSTDSPFNFARYNAVFYLLRELVPGDKVIVFFADKKYVYEVSQKHIVDAKDTSWLATDGSQEELVLQTCDPPGTTWRRLIVVAKPQIEEVYGGI